MKSLSAHDRFRPMPGLISSAGVTGSGHITYHAYVTLLSGLKMSPETHVCIHAAVYKSCINTNFTIDDPDLQS